MVELTPFTATARMEQSAAFDVRYGIGFDGLLTSLVRGEQKRVTGQRTGSLLDGGDAVDDPVTVPLPLATCQVEPWHWMATTAYPLGWDRQPLPVVADVHHVRYAHQREVAEQVAVHLPKHTSLSAGRYRSRRLPVVVFAAPFWQFRGVGDVAAVETLLASCPNIGSGRGAGEGAVLEWVCERVDGGDPDLFGHTHGDGTLGRPIPRACGERLQLEGESGRVGIRPPYWHRVRQYDLLLPRYPKDDDGA